MFTDYFNDQNRMNTFKYTFRESRRLTSFVSSFKPYVFYENSTKSKSLLERQIEEAIMHENLSIDEDLSSYPSVVDRNKPAIMSLLVTTWRSGSTFLGEVLNSHPVFR